LAKNWLSFLRQLIWRPRFGTWLKKQRTLKQNSSSPIFRLRSVRAEGRTISQSLLPLLETADGASLPELGRHFGGLLYEREARYLREAEWAHTAEDILQRRTKHGLHLERSLRDAFEDWLRAA
jgi:glycerol-3-phosphate dehydrogenase